MAPFGLKLCQNDAPDLRIIFQALLGPKTKLKGSKNLKMLKIPIFPVQSHQLYIETPDKPLQRLLCYVYLSLGSLVYYHLVSFLFIDVPLTKTPISIR